MTVVVDQFHMIAGEKWRRISKETLNYVYTKYWMPEKERRKRPFSRMFWYKHDLEENDPCNAFRRRNKDRMKLRRKTKMELECLRKMADLWYHSIDTLKIF